MPLDIDNSLRIQLLRFYRPSGLTDSYYFLEMSTLQLTTVLPQNEKITTTRVNAYTNNNKNLENNITGNFQTIGDFNNFFLSNSDYYIHDCFIELENGITVTSHDDGEVVLECPNSSLDPTIMYKIFEKHAIGRNILEMIKQKPGYYFALDQQNQISGVFETFEEYLQK